MLSEKTMAIVKSTAPVLQEHGETLTKHFYKRMFTHNPEVAPFFNPSNQHSGGQQRALAGAICAYAENIDNLAVLGNAVELIAQKHASLLVRADQYPIIGANLLASIKEVLGYAATDDIINAWGEAYNFLAGIFIAREQEIYDEQSANKNGWVGFKAFKVAKKENESKIITSLYLKPEHGEQLPVFKPGQYITVRMNRADGISTMRNYSLSDVSGQDYFRISVKREVGEKAETPKGYVSNQLHDQIKVGDSLEMAPPCGEFFLDTNINNKQSLMLLAGGIGITPIMSILQSALSHNKDREIVLLYGCRDEKVQAFKSTIDALAEKHDNFTVQYCFSQPVPQGISRNTSDISGNVSTDLIEGFPSYKTSQYYFCGPQAFMKNIYHHLYALGIPDEQIHFEFFGPKQDLVQA